MTTNSTDYKRCKEYGVKCGKNDMIDMYFDIDNGKLAYSVNDKYQE